MSRKRKLLAKVLAGAHNIRFEELCCLAESFGYRLDRVSGSHHIYEHPAVERPLNLQTFAERRSHTRCISFWAT